MSGIDRFGGNSGSRAANVAGVISGFAVVALDIVLPRALAVVVVVAANLLLLLALTPSIRVERAEVEPSAAGRIEMAVRL